MKTIPLILALLIATPAAAEFETTEDRLFTDWPQLHAYEREIQTEFQIHAIVDSYIDNKIIYVISGNHKGRVDVFGSAECGVEFTILDSYTNDMRDIKCVREDGLLHRSEFILKMGEGGLYVSHPVN